MCGTVCAAAEICPNGKCVPCLQAGASACFPGRDCLRSWCCSNSWSCSTSDCVCN
jgi:hypothetical protein